MRARRGTLAAWIATIARTRAIDRWRRLRPRDRAHAEVIRVSSLAVSDETWHVVAAAATHDALCHLLTTLSPTQRRAIDLAFFNGYTHSELARQLGWPLGTVKGRIRDGLRHLRASCAAAGLSPGNGT